MERVKKMFRRIRNRSEYCCERDAHMNHVLSLTINSCFFLIFFLLPLPYFEDLSRVVILDFLFCKESIDGCGANITWVASIFPTGFNIRKHHIAQCKEPIHKEANYEIELNIFI